MNATILGNSYFLDRLVVAVTSVVAAIGLALGLVHGIGLEGDAFRVGVYRFEATYPSATAAEIDAYEAMLLDATYPFDPFAPLYEQFAQFTWNVFTWQPLALVLVGCGVLAVAAQRYAS